MPTLSPERAIVAAAARRSVADRIASALLAPHPVPALPTILVRTGV